MLPISIAHFNRWVLDGKIKRETENSNLGRPFSPDLKEETKNGGLNIQKSATKDINDAVRFTDIMNFIQLSEKMNPCDVLVILSAYQSIIVEDIFEHNGTVDKLMGNAVMTIFFCLNPVETMLKNAFDSAEAMNIKH